MAEASARLLRLLSLLQSRRYWPGRELAGLLSVTGRTLRRDIDRLRSLGYPVRASPGTGGGYQLGAGARLPPLHLEDDEAMAVTISLRTAAAASSVAGLEEASVRAMAKLEQVLPERLRSGVAALQSSILPLSAGAPAVDLKTLSALADGRRDHRILEFLYEARGADRSSRKVEPCRVVHTGRRWYLVAWDLDRADWRTFRVDRIASAITPGARFQPKEPPDKDLAAWVSRSLSLAPYQHKARVILRAPIEEAASRIPPAAGLLEGIDEQSCVLSTGANSLDVLTIFLAASGLDFEVIEPAELMRHIRDLAGRLQRAAR